MLVDLGFLCLVNAYVAPRESNWWDQWHEEPMAKPAEAVIACCELGRPTLLMGDLNARTGDTQGGEGAPTRTSSDSTTKGHGNALIALAQAADLTILNGAQGYDPGSGATTSFNSATRDDRGAAVVDYIAANTEALPLVLDVHVLDRHGASDHVPVLVQLAVPGSSLTLAAMPVPKRKRAKHNAPEPLPRGSTLNCKLADLVEKAQSVTAESQLLELYGNTSGSFKESMAYTDGSCHSNGASAAAAGAGVYYGENSLHNIAQRVPGAQTNNRAEAFAILLALSNCKLNRALVIRSDSQWAIASLTHWAPKRIATGWKNKHGDILRECVRWLKARIAPTRFDYVRGHSGDRHNDGADTEANNGARMPAVGQFVPPDIPAPPPPPFERRYQCPRQSHNIYALPRFGPREFRHQDGAGMGTRRAERP